MYVQLGDRMVEKADIAMIQPFEANDNMMASNKNFTARIVQKDKSRFLVEDYTPQELSEHLGLTFLPKDQTAINTDVIKQFRHFSESSQKPNVVKKFKAVAQWVTGKKTQQQFSQSSLDDPSGPTTLHQG